MNNKNNENFVTVAEKMGNISRKKKKLIEDRSWKREERWKEVVGTKSAGAAADANPNSVPSCW